MFHVESNGCKHETTFSIIESRHTPRFLRSVAEYLRECNVSQGEMRGMGQRPLRRNSRYLLSQVCAITISGCLTHLNTDFQPENADVRCFDHRA